MSGCRVVQVTAAKMKVSEDRAMMYPDWLGVSTRAVAGLSLGVDPEIAVSRDEKDATEFAPKLFKADSNRMECVSHIACDLSEVFGLSSVAIALDKIVHSWSPAST